MRYFAHDGSTTHGPASVEELTAHPWFDGDVLVCPVGSQDSGDWKPALAYPAFKAALLAPKPIEPPKPSPPPVIAPRPQPVPCPHCASGNPPGARFCNDCGKRMDGTADAPPPSVEPSFGAPAFGVPASETPAFGAPATAEEPSRPMARPPERSGPMARPLAARSEPEPAPAAEPVPEYAFTPDPHPEHTFASLASQMPHPIEPAPEPASLAPTQPPAEPVYEPAARSDSAATPAWKRPSALAALAGLAALGGAAAWYALKPVPAPPAPSGADLELSAPRSSPAGGGEPSAAPAPVEDAFAPAPAATPFPAPKPTAKRVRKPAPPASAPAAARPRRKVRPAPPAELDISDAILIESRAPDGAAGPGGAPDGDKPLSDPDAAPASSDFLPGIPRRPGLKAPKPAKSAPKAATDAATSELDAALAETGAPAAVGGGAAKAAAAAANPADALALQQAVEEFEFCAQLLSQGAYADHFDTCLCKETREKAPYRNRRGFYVTSLQKEAAAGRLEVKAEIVSTRMENGVARIVAKWKARGNDPGREVDEAWIMDDGLWCKAP